MQDRFVGDIGDFGKYGLLRALRGIHPRADPCLKLGLAWYVPDSETVKRTPVGHGQNIGYLFNPKTRDRYRSCDEELFDGLQGIVCGHRSIEAVQDSGLLGDRASGALVIHDKPMQMPDGRLRHDERKKWLDEALRCVEKSEVVFLDPDVGLADPGCGKAPRRLSIGTKDAPKYVFMCELDEFLGLNASVVAYQSFGRNDPCKSMNDWHDMLCGRHPGREQPRILKYGSRAFIILPTAAHATLIDKRLSELTVTGSPWHNHFEPHCRGSNARRDNH